MRENSWHQSLPLEILCSPGKGPGWQKFKLYTGEGGEIYVWQTRDRKVRRRLESEGPEDHTEEKRKPS